MATISYSFPLFRRPICMQGANTKAQMGTARRCLEQITNIKAIAGHVRKGGPQAISEAKRRLELATKAFNEVNNVVLKEHRTRAANAIQAFVRAHSRKDILECSSERAWVPKSPSKGSQTYAEALAKGRNGYAEAEKVFTDTYRDLRKAQDKANYFEIADCMYKAATALQLEKDKLKQAKKLWRKALSSLKKTDPPTLQGRCIETICSALLPTCTETDLESLPIPEALRSDIATFCDCLYLIQGENVSVVKMYLFNGRSA